MFDLGPPPKLWTPARPAIIRAGETLSPKLSMPGFLGAFVLSDVKTLAHLGGQSDNTNLTTYTFTYSLGAARADRRIVVGVSSGNSNRTLSDVTVHVPTVASDPTGIPLTIIDQVVGNSAIPVAMAIGLIPSGTSAEITVTWSAGQLQMMMDAWTITGLSSNTPVDFGNSVTDPQSKALNTSSGGFCLAFSGWRSTSPPAPSWSNVVQDYDSGSVDLSRASAASASTTGATITPICDNGSDARHAMVAATF